MADKQETKQDVKQTANQKKVYEPTYTIAELMEASKEFETNSIVVRAALTKGGKETYTKKEASQLIERMKKKEVKS